MISYMAKYPVFLELKDRRVVVVGGGLVAFRKAEGLLEAGARVVVVARQTCGAMARLCQERPVELVRGRYSKEYLGQAALVIAATNDQDLNRQIYEDCQQLQIPCNVVDRPESCDFFVPAVIRRGDLVVAIGTEGFCPAYASHLRKKLEQVITPAHGQFLAELESVRRCLQRRIPDQTLRKGLLGQMVSDESFRVFQQQGAARWRRYATSLIRKATEGG